MIPSDVQENTQIVAVQSMCATATSAADEPRVTCIIRDLSSSSQDKTRSVINLPVSTTAVQLMQEVGKKFSYDPDSFELILQRKNVTTNIHEHENETLDELGFDCGSKDPADKRPTERNHLIICDKRNMPPKKVESSEPESTPESSFSAKCSQSSTERRRSRMAAATYVPAPPPYTSNTSTSDYSYSCSYSNALTRQDTGFVGLVNQAMTCYLNSLLQTLYMTPEFRNALYRWEFDGTEDEGSKSIPFQLQKLFLQLQTSNKPAVGTTELTTSFGWDSSEAWQQHDVQELCRVMFDALEQKFKNTEQADLISRLYEGKLKDYVKCLECGYESAREDTFLDVPLVVRPFGSSQAYASVGEALQAFVTPEILHDSNQYFCEHCNKKCDAHKGLKFTKFPYLLTLQLKRFDFDPVTMHRIKLNDRVSFPEILNLNDFIKSDKSPETNDDGDTTDSGSALDDEGICYASGCKTGCSLSPDAISDNDLPDDDEGIDVGPENNHELCVNERNLKKSMEKGPYVYELFSIMVHSGSANGGHYYAYIKSFRHGEWYCFNDAQVSRITYDDIQKTYGGAPSRGYYSSAYSSSTNAYMLMYRQIDKLKNKDCMSPEEFPEHIKALLQCMQEQEERERVQRELDRSMCKIKLFCQQPVQREMKLKVHKDCTLAEATATAHTIMGLENIVPLDCCRLVKYDDFNDSLECSFDPNTEETMGELLGGVKSSYKFDLLLEVKKPNEKFQEYKPGGTTIKVHVVDLEQEQVSRFCFTVRSHPSNTVEELRKQIADALSIEDSSKMRIVLEGYSEAELLEVPSHTLHSEGFGKSNKVFVEYKDAEDFEKPYSQSKLFKVLDVYAHTICIQVTLPKVDKTILDRLRLNDCDSNGVKDGSSSEDDEGKDSADVSIEEAHSIKSEAIVLENSTSEKVKQSTNSSFSWSCMKKRTYAHSKKRIRAAASEYETDSSSKNYPDYDEGLGDSEAGDTASSNGFPNSQAIHSDQSEDSSLTDSERTLVGDELSPRNNSPDIMGSEMDQDLEPVHVGVEVSKPECDTGLGSLESSCPVHGQEESRNLSSPEENTKDSQCPSDKCKNLCTCTKSQSNPEPPPKRHFRAYSYFDYETNEKTLRVYVDKRITLAELKKELEPHIGVGLDCFKMFRVYSSNQSLECTRLSDNLMSYGDDSRLIVKLGRALRKGEYKVKIYQLCVNEPEILKYLIDYVVVKGMTVLVAKKEILAEVQEKCNLNVPLNRCRLRKKSWMNPGLIYLDNQRFEKDSLVSANWEMFLEVLPEPEPLTSPYQVAVFTRMWHPSTFQLDPFKEIILDSANIECLIKKLSEVSQVPEEFIEFAKGQGTFPCEVSLLFIQKDLEWQTNSPSIITWPLFGDDGQVIYYRDKREELKVLTEEEKRIIINKENARSNKNLKSNYSPRKEKALKIYTLDSKPNNSAATSQANQQNSAIIKSTQVSDHIVFDKYCPDLD